MMMAKQSGGVCVFGQKPTRSVAFAFGNISASSAPVSRTERSALCLAASAGASSRLAGVVLYPPQSLPNQYHNGGSIMKIWLQREGEAVLYAEAERFGASCYIDDCPTPCWLCGGESHAPENYYRMYAEHDENNIEVVGWVCPCCAHLDESRIRASLEWQSYSFDYKVSEYDERGDEFREILRLITTGDLDGARDFIAERSDVVAYKSQLWKEKSDKFESFANNYDIQTLKTDNESKATRESKGFVYLLGSPDGYCKIGRTKQLSSRLLAIGLQLPFKVELIHSIKVSDPVWAERHLHQKFSACRMNGEWFLLSDGDIQWIKSLTRLEPEG